MTAVHHQVDDLADDALGLLDHLGIERVHFAGLSLGGMTGLRLAARDPDRLLVIDGAAHLANVEQPGAVTGAILEPAWTR